MATTDPTTALPSLQDRFYALPRRRQLAVLREAGCATAGAMFLSNIQLERIMNGISHGMARQEALATAAAQSPGVRMSSTARRSAKPAASRATSSSPR